VIDYEATAMVSHLLIYFRKRATLEKLGLGSILGWWAESRTLSKEGHKGVAVGHFEKSWNSRTMIQDAAELVYASAVRSQDDMMYLTC
jgi:hypothetical protein